MKHKHSAFPFKTKESPLKITSYDRGHVGQFQEPEVEAVEKIERGIRPRRRKKPWANDPLHERYRAEKLAEKYGPSHLGVWETKQRQKFGKDWTPPPWEGWKSFEQKIKKGRYTRGTPLEKHHKAALGIKDWSELD